jgi:D-tagatose-1,6-bisphosphate aldolase subunit GatZ/KbaZ
LLDVEATCKQVNQFGGYSGMQPKDFAELVFAEAKTVGLDRSKIVLAGDHLGPIPFKKEGAEIAMNKAEGMIAAYVKAGFTKIHIDCSEPCAGDDARDRAAWENVVAERTARLARVAVDTWKEMGSPEPMPFFVVGSEVPPPGGATAGHTGIDVTPVENVVGTVKTTYEAFERHGLSDVWSRVSGLVVQPGVEFGEGGAHPYDASKSVGLSEAIHDFSGLVYEAHSTDYLDLEGLTQLVKGHFAILKVGPELTYFMREGYEHLLAIEAELVPDQAKRSGLREAVIGAMRSDEALGDWRKYCGIPAGATPAEEEVQMWSSLTDRIRYYWNKPEARAALATLMENIRSCGGVTEASAKSRFKLDDVAGPQDPEALVVRYVRQVTGRYAEACGQQLA